MNVFYAASAPEGDLIAVMFAATYVFNVSGMYETIQAVLIHIASGDTHLDGAQDCALEHAALLREALSESV